jgi:exonuclease SbcC
MKILSLRFTNINSLKGDHYISFQDAPLADSGLILITGPTGSGKSTLLDVISLALYNRIPRLPNLSKKEIGELNSIMTHHTREARAEVQYESNGQRYISRWSIEINRNGNLNDYHMEIWHENSQQLLDLKRSDVADKNAEIIGLNYDQFIKSIVLSQGEFAQFLKAKQEDRAVLLEKITGTEIYRQLGKRAYEKSREAKQKVTAVDEVLQQLPIATDEEKKLLETDLETMGKELSTLAALVNELTQQNLLIEAVTKQKLLLDQQLSKHRDWQLLADAMQIRSIKIQQYEALLVLSGDLQLMQEAQQELDDLQQKLLLCEEQAHKHRQERQEIENLFTLKLRQEWDVVSVTAKIDELREKYAAYQSQLDTLIKKGEQWRQQTDVQVRALKTDLRQWYEPKVEPKTALSAIAILIQKWSSNLEGMPDDMGDLTQQLEVLSDRRMSLTEAKAWKEKVVLLTDQLAQLETSNVKTEQETLQLDIQIVESQGLSQTLNDEISKLRIEKEERLSQVALNELRSGLKPDQACPLCGSTNHPYCDNELTFTIGTLEIDLSQKEKKRKETELLLKDQFAKQSALSTQLRLQRAQWQQLHAERNEWLNKIKTADIESHDTATLDAQLTEIIKGVEKVQLAITSKQVCLQLLPIQQAYHELEVTVQEYKKVKEERDSQLPTPEDWDKMKSGMMRYQQLQQADASNKSTMQGFEQRQKTLQEKSSQLEKNLGGQLLQLNIPDYQTAWQLLTAKDEYEAHKQALAAYEKEGNAVGQAIAAIEKEIRAAEEKLPNPEIWAEIKTQLKAAQQNLQHVTEAKGRTLEKIEQWQASKSKYDQLLRQKVEAVDHLRKYELLNQLIGDAAGKNFANFAQELTMQHIVILANRRLSGLTDRYQLVVPTNDGRTDLYIRDLYLGGTERSVKTLSGGETFILSLALALSLSDLASKNVRLDSLFIDEGFGTLDNDTLDVVISTLEKLQEENAKTIGIISHVESLKERIVSQIRLIRDTSGISRIQLV